MDLDLAVLSLVDFSLDLDGVLLLPLPLLASSVLSFSPLKLLLRDLDSSWYLLADVTLLWREAGVLLVLVGTPGRISCVHTHMRVLYSPEKETLITSSLILKVLDE